jgi:5-methylcytosine-specific restriction endonuclease McrA
MNFLDKPLVLRLNKNWQALGKATIKDALIAMLSGNEFLKAAYALDIQYDKNEDGSWDFSKPAAIVPVGSFEEWRQLPVRDFDLVVHSARYAIRAPTVIVAQNFAKMPRRTVKVTKRAIWERDGGVCQYSGRKLTKGTGNIDHIIPQSKGGGDTWENLVLSHKDINSKKGDKRNEEVGLKLLRQPKAPLPIPISASIKELNQRDWKHFINLE